MSKKNESSILTDDDRDLLQQIKDSLEVALGFVTSPEFRNIMAKLEQAQSPPPAPPTPTEFQKRMQAMTDEVITLAGRRMGKTQAMTAMTDDFIVFAGCSMGKTQARKLLTVLAQNLPGLIGKEKLALDANVNLKNGIYAKTLKTLINHNFILEANRGALILLEKGKELLEQLGGFHPLPKGRDGIKHWIQRVSTDEADILEELDNAKLTTDQLLYRLQFRMTRREGLEAIKKLQVRGLITRTPPFQIIYP